MAFSYEKQQQANKTLENLLRNNVENDFSLEGNILKLKKPLHTNVNYLPDGWKFDEQKGTFIYSDQENIYELKIERQKIDNIRTQADVIHELKRLNEGLEVKYVNGEFKIDKTLDKLNWEELRQQGFIFDQNRGLINPNILAGGEPLCLRVESDLSMTNNTGESVDNLSDKDSKNINESSRENISGEGQAQYGSEGLKDGDQHLNDLNITNSLNSKQDLREYAMKYYIDIDENKKITAVERTTNKKIEDPVIIKKVQLAENLIRTYYAMKGDRDYNRKTLNEAELKTVFDSNDVIPKIFVSICLSVEDAMSRGMVPSLENIAEASAIRLGGEVEVVKKEIRRIIAPKEMDLISLEKMPGGRHTKREQLVKIVSGSMGINEQDAVNYLQNAPELLNEQEEAMVMERKREEETDRI